MRIYSRRQKRAIWPFLVVPVLCLLLLVVCASPAVGQGGGSVERLQQIGKTFAQIAEKASPAVVRLQADKASTSNRRDLRQWPFIEPFRRYFGQPYPQSDGDFYYFFRPDEAWPRSPAPKRYQRLEGCGFIVSKDGYILTNEHVVRDARKINVTLADNRDFEGKIIGADPETDIAVLKIDADNLPFLVLGDSDALEVGEWVVAVNGPWGAGHPFAGGMVTAKGRSGLGLATYENFIQTDVAMTLGQDGGPLLDLDGKVVGINTAIIDRESVARVSLAIPANMVKLVYERLVEHGKVERGFLGVSIQDVSPDMAKALGLKDAEGVVVSEVIEDSAAEKAGVKRHDVIVELNGKPLKSADQLRWRIALLKPGAQVELVVLRDGKRQTFAVTLGKRSPARRTISAGPDVVKRLGFTVQDLTAELAEHLGYKGESGVVVTEVVAGSEAASKGIAAGALILEVNRKPVKNTPEFSRAVEQAGKKGTILLLVKDRQYTRFVLLKLK